MTVLKGLWKKSEHKTLLSGRKHRNRRLLDKKIEIDFEKPWNILTFSEETLKKMCGDRVRNTPKKISKNVENSLWWRRLLLKRTYFESIVA